jgi:hypothetical protein
MVMGDLVLTEEEVNPIMAKLLASGIEVTAVHNHPAAQPADHDVHACTRTRRSGEGGGRAA